MKFFLLFSVGSYKIKGNSWEPILNVEPELLESRLVAYLQSKSWIKPEEYIPFIENAQVGDMIVLKGMIGLVRLRESEEDNVNWTKNDA